MKKTLVLLLLILGGTLGFAKPDITNVSFPEKANIFDLFEISFNLGLYANPYDPQVINVYAEFTGPDKRTCTVAGFYYESYAFEKAKGVETATATRDKGWRIRFTPTQAGVWTFTLHAIDANGHTTMSSIKKKGFSFQCDNVKTAKGFITKANTRYFKQEVVVNGKKQHQSYFPVGPNIAWYDCADYGQYKKPYGIYDYNRYIDSLSGNCNYMRIWLNRYQFLSLYGPEHAITKDGRPVMYFDASMNQKDAAELDHIVQYASKHGIAIMPCFFNYRNFTHKEGTDIGSEKRPYMPSDWKNNPYHLILGLDSPYQFFTDPQAKRVSKNMIRYIIARWGYATNMMCWELWNEVGNISDGQDISANNQRNIAAWHSEMASYIRDIDPYGHPITTSLGNVKGEDILSGVVFNNLDFVQDHNYQNIHKAKSAEQFSYILFRESNRWRQVYEKPFFMGEFAFGQSKPNTDYLVYDPHGVDLHNALWSSFFSGSAGPASFWYWKMFRNAQWHRIFKPILTFSGKLPVLSDSFTAKTTGVLKKPSLIFPNNLETYYLINTAEDTLMGWCQDDAFNYQALRQLTDKASQGHFTENGVFDPKGYVYTLDAKKRPKPSSSSNTIVIPIDNQPVRTEYAIRWYDPETGLEITSEATTAKVRRRWFAGKELRFAFPSSIRDVDKGKINNTYGDAVFVIYKISDSAGR